VWEWACGAFVGDDGSTEFEDVIVAVVVEVLGVEFHVPEYSAGVLEKFVVVGVLRDGFWEVGMEFERRKEADAEGFLLDAIAGSDKGVDPIAVGIVFGAVVVFFFGFLVVIGFFEARGSGDGEALADVGEAEETIEVEVGEGIG